MRMPRPRKLGLSGAGLRRPGRTHCVLRGLGHRVTHNRSPQGPSRSQETRATPATEGKRCASGGRSGSRRGAAGEPREGESGSPAAPAAVWPESAASPGFKFKCTRSVRLLSALLPPGLGPRGPRSYVARSGNDPGHRLCTPLPAPSLTLCPCAPCRCTARAACPCLDKVTPACPARTSCLLSLCSARSSR